MAKQRSADRIAADDAATETRTLFAPRCVTSNRCAAELALGSGAAPDPGRVRAKPPLASADLDEGDARSSSAAAESVGGRRELSFRRPGVRTQEMRRLRRGLYPIEEELDLHGLESDGGARRASPISSQQSRRRPPLRQDHSRQGLSFGRARPDAEDRRQSWLRRHADVMAFTSARAIDGGTGAVYVLLRA